MHNCCDNCFKQEDINSYIRGFRLKGDCCYCGKKNVNIASTKEIGRFIRNALDKAYEELGENTGSMYDSEEGMYIDLHGNKAGISIEEILNDEEDIFNCASKTEQLLLDLFADSGISQKDKMDGEIDKFEDVYEEKFVIKNALYGRESIAEYYNWEEFKHLVKYYNRFFDMDSGQKKRDELLDSLKPYFKRMSKKLKKGTAFYRVRKMDIQSAEQFNSLDLYKELSPAPPEFSVNNRMSPAGISYLYIATHLQTAYTECRLHNGDRAIQARFVTKSDLTVLDLSKKVYFQKSNSIFSADYDHDFNWINDFLNGFEDEISRPINPKKDKSYEYIATQIVAEYVRFLGYDGIEYRSSVDSNGSNYVFFCGPNKDISGLIYDSDYGFMEYNELKYYTDWFYIEDAKTIEIREEVKSSVRSNILFSVADVKRSDIDAKDIFCGFIGSFSYNSFKDIEQFVKDIPRELMKDNYGKNVSDDIVKHLLESIVKGDREVHQFFYNRTFGYLDIKIDDQKYRYENGKNVYDYIHVQ